MSMTIKIEGLRELLKTLNKAEKNLPILVEKSLERSSFFVWKTLSANTPVDTGNLKDSNRRKLLPWEAHIGPDTTIAPYAQWVENGHHTRGGTWVPGQHYIQRTQLETGRGVIEIFDRVFRDLFN